MCYIHLFSRVKQELFPTPLEIRHPSYVYSFKNTLDPCFNSKRQQREFHHNLGFVLLLIVIKIAMLWTVQNKNHARTVKKIGFLATAIPNVVSCFLARENFLKVFFLKKLKSVFKVFQNFRSISPLFFKKNHKVSPKQKQSHVNIQILRYAQHKSYKQQPKTS